MPRRPLSKPLNLLFWILLSSAFISLSACLSEEEKTDDTGQTESAPQLTMQIPASMSSSSAATRLVAASNLDACAFNADEHGDWVSNGYRMSKFLVALSQSQSCFTDGIIEAIMAVGHVYKNKGKQPVPTSESDPDAPKFVEYVVNGSTSQIWLHFDETATKRLYITWVKQTDGYTGSMTFAGFDPDPSDPGAPNRIRVDFVRSASGDTNDIYMGFSAGHPAHIVGFHVQVSATPEGESTIYHAKGLLQTDGHFMPNLPTTETFSFPQLAIATVANDTGEGATRAIFSNLALHLQDGDQATDGWNLGSYQYTDQEKVYFSGTGIEQWKAKTVVDGLYVNTSGTNNRGGVGLPFIIDCLEDAVGCNGIPVMALGTGYFTAPCSETDDAVCTDLIQAIHNLGFLGNMPNSTEAEPTIDSDWRVQWLNDNLPLDALWPTGEDGVTTFTIPATETSILL